MFSLHMKSQLSLYSHCPRPAVCFGVEEFSTANPERSGLGQEQSAWVLERPFGALFNWDLIFLESFKEVFEPF
jgi:hypothetical protein